MKQMFNNLEKAMGALESHRDLLEDNQKPLLQISLKKI